MRRATLIASTAFVGLALVACSGGDDETTADASDAGAPQDSADDAETAEEPAGDELGEEEPSEESDDASAGGEAGDAAQVTSAAIQAIESGRHVIYYVDLYIETDNVARATQQAAALAETSGGFVSNESTSGDRSATLTLRVPVDEHASIISQLETLGEVRERYREAQDVTSEVVDVDSRIGSQQRSIARIRELLDAATDLGDVVSIESELARRESNLDSLLSRQAELGSLTTLATITVTFQQIGENTEHSDEDDPSFISGLESGWNAFTSAVTYVGAGLGAVLPFAGTALVVGAPFVLLRRRRSVASAKLDE